MSNESGAVSYPKSGENIGRGIKLMHNGKVKPTIISVTLIIVFFNIYFGLIAFILFSAQAYSFTFDKVFEHSASQEHVFIEIFQLVQSALDGYKVQWMTVREITFIEF